MQNESDQDHLNRAQLAERLTDADGAELAGYLVAETDERAVGITIRALHRTRDRMVVLAAGCAYAADVLRMLARAR